MGRLRLASDEALRYIPERPLDRRACEHSAHRRLRRHTRAFNSSTSIYNFPSLAAYELFIHHLSSFTDKWLGCVGVNKPVAVLLAGTKRRVPVRARTGVEEAGGRVVHSGHELRAAGGGAAEAGGRGPAGLLHGRKVSARALHTLRAFTHSRPYIQSKVEIESLH